MTDYKKALSLAEDLIDKESEMTSTELKNKIIKLSNLMQNMRLLDANNIINYMKELVLLTVPEDKKELIKKYL